MNKNNINISDIESHLYSLFNKKVSSHTYVGTLPDTTSDKWQDMCLVDCGNISDIDAMGTGSVLVFLYAKPKSDGSKNLPVMSKMEHALIDVLENSNNEVYRISRLNTYQDFDPERKWHCNIVELKIKIF